MQPDRQRLGAGDLAQAHVLHHRRELRFSDHELLSEQARQVRKDRCAAQEHHLFAEVAAARPAGRARAARVGRVHGHFLAHAHPRDPGADGIHHARSLMTGHEGRADGEGARAAVLVVMQVGAADAARAQAQTDLACGRFDRRQVLHAQLQRAVQGAGEAHFSFPWRRSATRNA
ncbi:hypothetical protein D9M69_563030 [compost metagenome]